MDLHGRAATTRAKVSSGRHSKGAPPITLSTALACHDCDLLHPRLPLKPGEAAVCSRCGSVLARGGHEVAHRTFAYALASLILLIVANLFPFMEFRIAGRVQVARLITGVTQLHADGYSELAAMVLFTSILAPVMLIVGLIAVTVPILTRRRYRWMPGVGKLVARIKTWSMMEVFLLGVIVSAIKLGQMAEIVFGPALFAFLGLIVTSTAALAIYEPSTLWDYLDEERDR